MTILPIVLAPNPILRKKCAKVTRFDQPLHTFVQDMFDTMYNAPGIGLAAPQVDKDMQIFVMDCHKNPDGSEISEDTLALNPTVSQIAFINPKILKSIEQSSAYEEGCLSLPGYEISVTRPDSVLVEYQDIHGKIHRKTFCDLPARCIQHEMDHLNGKLIVDYVSQLRRNRILRSLREKQQASD